MAIHYRPILKAKQGEFGALQTLTTDVRASMTPILEPLPTHSTVAGYESFVKQLVRSWPKGQPLLLDHHLAKDAKALLQCISLAADELLKEGVVHIPTTGVDRDSDLTDAIARIAKFNKQGAAIRLGSNALGDLAALPAALAATVKRLKLAPHEVDLIIDLYAFGTAQSGMMVTAGAAAIRALPMIAEWRSLTVAGTSFPQDLSALKRDTITKIPRAEWSVWERLKSQDIPRVPDFGDYGISHPVLPDVDPVVMNMSANLRYTIANRWLVFKGKDVKKYKYEQFNEFCRQLVKMEEYSRAGFSWGDATISALCKADAKPGNASTWRKIGTSHHLTFVVQDLAS